MSKFYLPQNLINSNYFYSVNNDYITIKTNNNCYNNYNTTYCDCYNVYLNLDYLTSNSYSCPYTVSNQNLSYNNFTSEFYYRKDFVFSLIIFVILFFFILYFPYRIIARLFGRWFKV